LGACAHSPKPYAFTAAQTGDDVDIVVRTLAATGLKPAQIDRQRGTVTTQWFDTGYRFREIDDFRELDYDTDIFLRYRIAIQRAGAQETVVLETDVQRCSPTDSYVTNAGVTGSCQPMAFVFPTQQRQLEALGEKLRLELGQPDRAPNRM
jgi:hypothetical protein